MPPIWSGRRRILLIELALLGSLQAIVAIIMSLTVMRILEGATGLSILLIATVLAIGGARWVERVISEDLGQDYVHQIRAGLVTAALTPGNTSSLGVTVTRASNDLSAVRNWIALGIVPLVTGIPLISVVVAVLFLQDWRTGLAVSAPILGCVALLPMLARWTLKCARELRRRRGRMAARIADSVMAGESVRAAGAIHREINAVSRDSEKVVNSAVQRAWATGLTRAVMVTGASISTVAVVLSGHLDAQQVAGTMMLLGVLTTPIGDLGRVVEYRQNHRAATRILVPQLQQATDFMAWDAGLVPGQAAGSGVIIGELHAEAGEHIHLTTDSPHAARTLIAQLIDGGEVSINGQWLADLPLKERRNLIGVASAHHHLERGSISRLASYRVPDASDYEIRGVLERVGLLPVVEADARGLSRQLKNGGAPWNTHDVERLKLARAILREPPLLIMEDLNLPVPDNYPGVIITTGAAGAAAGAARTWNPDGINV
ncbi:putative multidrug resistance ABC transporter ATP-binding/permease protein YheI [Corynebacterium faecale]|uniref:ABC transporter transmembrane domain-containing protein n=1 Tax=Corynebacterium faecale TaxID=1758466 RepID=UPI0025B3E5A7|nr:ABC transporter ATP-binding protein [Corynebacterium faecale]WJY91059.1 putative multidrug resistance ABC transporter ATP-binding/permease protein YheI [Corynebacterium faecale]